MDDIKSFKITINDANQRLDRYLLKNFKNLNRTAIYKMIRTKDILLNNKKTDFKYMLKENDEVLIYSQQKFLQKTIDTSFSNARDELDVIYEDKNILVVFKPIGLIVHEDEKNKVDTLQNRIKKYLAKKNEYNPFDESAFTPSICHRLDLNTSGLLVAAKTAEALRLIEEMFRENDVIRQYIVMTYNKLPKNNDTVYNYMHKNQQNMMIVEDFKTSSNKTAITKYHYLFKHKNYYIYNIELLTGRTHQIRAFLNHLKAPIVGEQKYITKDISKNEQYQHQCLVSYKIKFTNINKYNKNTNLLYLNNKEFTLDNIWFLEDKNTK